MKTPGHKEMSQEQVATMEKVRAIGTELDALITHLQALEATDKRWVAIGKTDLQTGLMALIRSIAKPDFF